MNLPPFVSHKPLSEVCTFGIGGPARLFTDVSEIEQMQAVLRYCLQEKLPFFILGKGSNCLFDDRGFDGLVIRNKISYLAWEEEEVRVGAGYSFSLLGLKTAKKDLTGLEFASGIPATVGGAVFMNAGAGGKETKDCLLRVLFVEEDGTLSSYEKDGIDFGYRFSSFQKKKGAVVGAVFKLSSKPKAREEQSVLLEYRKKTQPYQDPSAGCIFRNPPGMSAGALIERSGLKGLRIGGIEVSPVHANFLVNTGEGRAEEVLELIAEIQHRVKERFAVELEPEVRWIPYQNS